MTTAFLAALAGDPALSRDDRIHMLASWLVLSDDRDEAAELLSFEPWDWEARRAYLHLSTAWDAAEALLDGRWPVAP